MVFIFGYQMLFKSNRNFKNICLPMEKQTKNQIFNEFNSIRDKFLSRSEASSKVTGKGSSFVHHYLHDMQTAFNHTKEQKAYSSKFSEDLEPIMMGRKFVPNLVPIEKRRKSVKNKFSKKQASYNYKVDQATLNLNQSRFGNKRLERKSVFSRKSRSLEGQTSQKTVSKYNNFVQLEKKNQDSGIIVFYRNIKENLKSSFNHTEINRETVRENHLKKYKEIIANAVLEKRSPTVAFTYEGDIIPVIPINAKVQDKKYVDVEAEVETVQQKVSKVQSQEKKEKSRSEKILIPSQKQVLIEEAESDFQKNFKKLSLSKNVAIVNNTRPMERKSQFYLLGKSEKKNDLTRKKISLTPQPKGEEDIKIMDEKQFQRLFEIDSLQRKRPSLTQFKENIERKRELRQVVTFMQKEMLRKKDEGEKEKKKGILKKRKIKHSQAFF